MQFEINQLSRRKFSVFHFYRLLQALDCLARNYSIEGRFRSSRLAPMH
jgi:hypothetical protein